MVRSRMLLSIITAAMRRSLSLNCAVLPTCLKLVSAYLLSSAGTLASGRRTRSGALGAVGGAACTELSGGTMGAKTLYLFVAIARPKTMKPPKQQKAKVAKTILPMMTRLDSEEADEDSTEVALLSTPSSSPILREVHIGSRQLYPSPEPHSKLESTQVHSQQSPPS